MKLETNQNQSQSESPALPSINLSLKEATALVKLLQREWIGHDEDVNEALHKLQRFVYHDNSGLKIGMK